MDVYPNKAKNSESGLGKAAGFDRLCTPKPNSSSRLDIACHVVRFLEQHVPEKSLLLVGFSGGIDSTALLMALSLYKDRWPLHAIHIDHGWRKESVEEAIALGQRITSMDIPFSSFQLGKAPKGENLEDWSRNERYRCFRVAAQRLNTRFLLLAHQANDQTESVFKRMLEGSSITKFRGIKAKDEREGLVILRPLLGIHKQDLSDWLQDQKIPFLVDPSNADCTFLRARMREEIFPYLRTAFGKNFEDSLLRVSKEAGLLEEFVQEQINRNFLFQTVPGATIAFAKSDASMNPFLISRLVDYVSNKERFCLSRKQKEGAVAAFCSGGAPKQFFAGSGVLYAEERIVTAFSISPTPLPEIICDTVTGEAYYHSWKLAWRKVTFQGAAVPHWTNMFSSQKISLYVPLAPFTIRGANDRLLRGVPRSREATPSSLRRFVPSVIQGGQIVSDLLNGYQIPLTMKTECLEITFRPSTERCLQET